MFFTQSISQSFISSSCCTVHLFGAVFSQSLSQIFWSCAIRPFPVFPVYAADVWCSATDAGAVLRKFRKGEKITDTERKYASWKNVQVRSFILDKLKAITGT